MLLSFSVHAQLSTHAQWSTQVLHSNVNAACEAFDVPSDIIYAIMQVESSIWPWTIHLRGRSYYFQSKEAAIKFTKERQQKGERGFNMGLMQIYWPIHKNSFKDITQIFDPKMNIFFAAKLLKNLKNELGTWEKAVKAYHSRIEKYGNLYAKKISAKLGYPLESI
jgi:soluble lytic murein transglycosylase-like protein